MKLPADVTTFVGRRAAAAGIRGALGQARLVTLTGPAGVGKTRLALRVTYGMASHFAGQVWLVELAHLSDPALVPGAAATAVEVRDISARDPLDALADHLADRRGLLVLDNCEHLLDACVVMVEALLPRAPRLRILATSREPLGVDGEHIYPVPPLATPPCGDSSPPQRDYEATALFRERSAAAAPEVALDDALVARICRRLDGLPLAIELAVAWLRVLPLAELDARLDDQFMLLARRHGGTPRHQTLRAAIDWSAGLCTNQERLLWGRLALFPGGADLDAVEAVCADATLPTDAILPTLAALVDKSILTCIDSGRGRYRMLETLRQYGAGLIDDEQATGVRRRHRDYYRRLATTADAAWHGPDQPAWLERIRADRPNIDAALEYCCRADDIRAGMQIAGHLWWWWCTRDLREGRRWLQRVLDADDGPPSPERALALWACGMVACGQGDTARALDLLREGITVARAAGDATAVAYATQWLGMAHWMRGDLPEATRWLRTALDLHRADVGDLTGIAAIVPAQLGMVTALQGDPDAGIELGAESVRLCDAVGEDWVCAWSTWNLAVAHWSRGDRDDAVAYTLQALRHQRRISDTLAIPFALELLAWAAADQDAVRAATLLGAADTMWEPVGAPLFAWSALQHWSECCRKATRTAITQAAYQAAYQHGQRIPTSDAVAYALGETVEPPTRAAASPDDDDTAPAAALLTRREREVATLIADGLTNQQIADQLTVTVRTVATHVEHIMRKLEVNRRTRIAALIRRLGETGE